MSRRSAREDAIRLLFQENEIAFDYYLSLPTEDRVELFATAQPTKSEIEYISRVTIGVTENMEYLRQVIQKYSQNRAYERIGKTCLTILNIALFEILFCEDIPVKTSINEGIELARLYGDDKMAKFVNGVLDNAAKTEDAQ